MATARLHRHYILRILVTGLGMLFILLAFLYVYLLCKSVLNVVMREEMEHHMVALNSKIGEMEFDYLSLKTNVDRIQADTLGLTQVEGKSYVTRQSLARALTLNR